MTHEVRIPVRGDPRILQATYIPDHQPDGSVAGVYSLVHDMTHVKEVEEQLLQLARVDTLTGIANRRMFGETLHHALDRARRSGRPLALAYLGRKEEALRQAEALLALAPAPDGVFANGMQSNLVAVSTMVGDSNRAIAGLERLLTVPSGLTRGMLRVIGNYDPLRSDPRFQRLVAAR